MAQLKKNAVKFGISNAHIAFIDDDGGYEEVMAIPGTVSITTDPQGNSEMFYADNRAYYTTTSNKGYTGSIETAGFPDEIEARMLGQEIDAMGGVVECGGDKPNAFALGGEIDGDPLKRRFWFYKVTISRTSMNAQTVEESVTVTTDTHDMTITGVDADGYTDLVKYYVSSDSDAFGGFFDRVLFPKKKSTTVTPPEVAGGDPDTGGETETA